MYISMGIYSGNNMNVKGCSFFSTDGSFEPFCKHKRDLFWNGWLLLDKQN